MLAIEFQARIKDGVIKIPEIYSDRLRDSVRVILLVDEATAETESIQHWLRHPLKVPGFLCHFPGKSAMTGV